MNVGVIGENCGKQKKLRDCSKDYLAIDVELCSKTSFRVTKILHKSLCALFLIIWVPLGG